MLNKILFFFVNYKSKTKISACNVLFTILLCNFQQLKKNLKKKSLFPSLFL